MCVCNSILYFAQLNSIKANNLIKKKTEELNWKFSKEDIQMANKPMKRCSTLLITGKCKSKTQWDYHLPSFRMAIIKMIRNSKCWRVCGEKGTLIHCGWGCKLMQSLWKIEWGFLKKNTAAMCSVAQLWPTLCDPIGCSPPGSSVD